MISMVPQKMYDINEHREAKRLDKEHILPFNDSIDSVYFFCHGDLKQCVKIDNIESSSIDIVLRLARRQNRTHEFWLWIILNKNDNNNKIELVSPQFPTVELQNSSPTSWNFPTGLQINCNRPNEHWIIRYSGWVKKLHTEEFVHLDMKLNFRAFTNIVDSHKETSLFMTADAVARENWSRKFFQELKQLGENNQTHYEQWGGYDGYLKLDRSNDILELTKAKGYRDHSFGIRNWSQYQKYCAIFGYLENGTCVSMGAVSCLKTLHHMRYGYLITPFGDTRPLTSHSLDLKKVIFSDPPLTKYSFQFTTDDNYVISVESTNETRFSIKNGSTIIIERFVKLNINGLLGWGVNEFCVSDPPTLTSIPMTIKDRNEENQESLDPSHLCFKLTEPNSLSVEMCGGKGSQLASLYRVQKKIGSDQFLIPRGFVITTKSYEMMIQENENVTEKIEEIEILKKSWNENQDEILEKCQQISDMISDVNVPDKVKESIDIMMVYLFGSAWRTSVKVAVRSSSIDEDGAAASSAGQMETVLGVYGEQELYLSIAKCWSSLYSQTAIQYRHLNSMDFNSKMALVIMEMVPSEVSGVLFTANPTDADFSRMLLNASFGLGESVVSGKSEPDTIIIEKPKLPNDIEVENFKIVESIIGSKLIRLDMKMEQNDDDSSGGIIGTEVENNLENSQKLSLSNEQIIKIARVGRIIEQYYGEPRDIEWAINKEGELSILQSRPITSLNQSTDEEIVKELDSSISCEEECLTTCNIGEMMPQAVTPLTYSMFGRGIDRAFQKSSRLLQGVFKEYILPIRCLPSYSNHLFINISTLGLMFNGHVIGGDIKHMNLVLIGRMLTKPTNTDLLWFTGVSPAWKRFLNFIVLGKYRSDSYNKTKEWEKKLHVGGYKIQEKSSSKEQMRVIINQLDDYFKCWADTATNSGNSTKGTIIFATLLEKYTKSEPDDIFGKVAVALSSCGDVISADVPNSINKLAKTIIQNSESLKIFKEGNVENCLNWLTKEGPDLLKEEFQNFLEKHGHRCIREAEFRENSWRSDPINVVEMIKSVVIQNEGRNTVEKKILSVEEAIEQVSGKISFIKKSILKYFLKQARSGVATREWGKSLSIEMVEVFKKAFKNLGILMYKENRIPDPDLVYFFTIEELDDLILTNSLNRSTLVQKALRRRKVLPVQMDINMPDICFGTPIVEKYEDIEYSSTEKSLKGFPVSPGRIKGIARVVTSLVKAKSIKPQDILIVPYTDIGWTPYFPIISGLVTEKGGLISHGAVIAREYGLPCIVSCKNACQVFSSGDKVMLDGGKGTISLCD